MRPYYNGSLIPWLGVVIYSRHSINSDCNIFEEPCFTMMCYIGRYS